jgi:endonuclease/exonuclease/phosphatase family metal-dependent hydrolase
MARRPARLWTGVFESVSVRIVTYNIHKCVGIDRRRSVARIARVIEETDADVVALQEVVRRETPTHHRDDHHDQARALASLLGMTLVAGPAYKERWGEYGNVVLTRLPVVGQANFDISHPRREPRACMRVDLELAAGPLHFYNTHLGTSLSERHAQSRRLAEVDILLGSHPERPQVLVGDFNDWFPSAASRLLGDHLHDVTRRLRPTYPVIVPFLRLDKVYVNGHVRCRHIEVHTSRLARVASDHAPIVATVEVDHQRMKDEG